jgi:hypothetical protein
LFFFCLAAEGHETTAASGIKIKTANKNSMLTTTDADLEARRNALRRS